MVDVDQASRDETGDFDRRRREVLKGVGAAATLASLGADAELARAAAGIGAKAADANTAHYPRYFQWTLIDEKGTREFPGWRPGEPEIWCYTDQMSYTEGTDVALRVHTTCPTFDVRVRREGVSQAIVFQKSDIRGIRQHTADDAAIKGCNWSPALTLKTAGWKPGVYIVYLSARQDSKEANAEHFFVIRHARPGTVAKTCLVLPTSTYIAYNDWGGANHYRSIRNGVSTDVLEPRLSTQRPWGRGFVVRPKDAPDVIDPGTPPPFWHPEYPEVLWPLANHYSRHYVEGYATYAAKFIPWLEKNGYAIEVATQHDLHERPEMFANYRTLLFIGHDEYWSWEMRDTVDQFVDAGGKVARFGGNFWCQIRLEDGGRTHVCYKSNDDPVLKSANPRRAAIGWDTPEVNRPAAQTFGIHATGYSRYGATTPRSPGGFTVYRPWHWVFEKTDLYYGDVFGSAPINVFGFEVDGLDYEIRKGLPYPTGSDHPPENLQILALGLAVSGEPDRWGGKVLLNAPIDYGDKVKKVTSGEKKSASEEEKQEHGALPPAEPGAETAGKLAAGLMTYFERGKGAVFAAGSCTWARGLEMNDYYTQQITKNVLNRFIG